MAQRDAQRLRAHPPYDPSRLKPQPRYDIAHWAANCDLTGPRHRPGARPLFEWFRRRVVAGIFVPPIESAEQWRFYVEDRNASSMQVEACGDVWKSYWSWRQAMMRIGGSR